MKKDILNIKEDILDILNEFRRSDGDFDTDYLKDMVDDDTLDIGDLVYKVDRLCELIK